MSNLAGEFERALGFYFDGITDEVVKAVKNEVPVDTRPNRDNVVLKNTIHKEQVGEYEYLIGNDPNITVAGDRNDYAYYVHNDAGRGAANPYNERVLTKCRASGFKTRFKF